MTVEREKGHPVLLRLPAEMMQRLRAVAKNRTVPVATVARQLLKERLDQLEQEQRDHERGEPTP